MSLIRNGGFERGDIAFWEMVSGASFVASDADKLYGTYSGLLTADAAGNRSVRVSDFIRVNPFDTLVLSRAIKSTDASLVRAYMYLYDGNGDQVGYQTLQSTTPDGTWQEEYTYIDIPFNVYYIRVQLTATFGGVGETIYIDAVALAKLNTKDLVYNSLSLCILSNLVASGDTSTAPLAMIGYRDYYAEIEVTSMTGTNPTCDVTVCETDTLGNERVIGTFTQFNAATDQRVGIAPPIGSGMYVKYVMGGTVTDCDFKVSVIGVR